MLAPKAGERILDLGCGDGALTEKLVAAGCGVVAVDASAEQVAGAVTRDLDARVARAEALPFEHEFAAVLQQRRPALGERRRRCDRICRPRWSTRAATPTSARSFDIFRDAAFRPAPVLLVRPDGDAAVAAAELDFPNGSVITPDGRTLIVGETFGGRLTAFDIRPDGTLAGRRTLFVCTAPTHHRDKLVARPPSGRIEVVDVAVAGAGLP